MALTGLEFPDGGRSSANAAGSAAPAQPKPGRAVARDRVMFLGCHLDDCTLDEAVSVAAGAMRTRIRLQHGDVNVAKFVGFRHDGALRRFTEESDLICADGMGIVWACRLMGIPIRERVTGIDFMTRLIEVCARDGTRPYFLGARQDVLEEAIARVRTAHPGLEVAGWHNGYFTRDEEPAILADIKASGADCLFVGMPSPQKESFLNRYRDELDVPVQLGVGGSFDVLAGHVRRAPAWMRRCGLEWFFRLAQEPRRLWWRYLSTNVQFAAIMAWALGAHAGRRLATRIGLRA